MILGIHHLSIIVSSEESVKFYRKLGFTEENPADQDKGSATLITAE